MVDTWSDATFRDALQLIAEGVTELVGFEVAVVSVVRDDGRFEVIAVAGSDEARDQILGHRTPVADIEAELANADDWGTLQFVPAQRMGLEIENLGWVPDIEPSDDPSDWHPLDLLMAPVYDDRGELRGMMSMDVPTDGKRPGPEKRAWLEKYAVQAGRALITADDRARLAERIRLAETARDVVRRASAEHSLQSIFTEVGDALLRGFGAWSLWIRTFDDEVSGVVGTSFSSQSGKHGFKGQLAPIGQATAQELWRRQEVGVLTPTTMTDTLATGLEEVVRAFLAKRGVASLLFIPLGVGALCLGNLVLTREPGGPEWTDSEKAAALDLGHDLGRILLTHRTLEQERRLNQELRALDTFKSELVATVSHELRNPLSAVQGYLELLSDDVGSGPWRGSIESMTRGVERMSTLVDDLLVLSRAGDPSVEVPDDLIDIGLVVTEAIDLLKPAIKQKGIRVTLVESDAEVCTRGSRPDLDRVVSNLLSNAVKYSHDGGEVAVRTRLVGGPIGTVELAIADQGLGISADDQLRLFTEFFRSTNPAALPLPGTGLGLAIVKRLVERHHGSVDVQSTLGEGSTFTVRLPSAP